MNILVLNAGSSSLKFSLIEAQNEQLLAAGEIDRSVKPARLMLRRADVFETQTQVTLANQQEAVAHIIKVLAREHAAPLSSIADIHAVGHRVVHGGDKYASAVRITPEVQRVIGELSELAPLHNPVSLEVIKTVEQSLPGVPQVAAFDTSFQSTMPEMARIYPLPREWTRTWNLRRYGFHGLSHQYCTDRAAELLGRNDLRLIIAHLGNGASISAVSNGVCVDTSMGFTPMEGLMMGTRSGSVDPGLLLYLMRAKNITADQLDHALNYESGLLGVSGISSDLREVLAKAKQNPDAQLALDIYTHRIQQTIGAMAATLGGVDALVFTAGVGEHAPAIRRRVCDTLRHLGIVLDHAANDQGKPDSDIAAGTSQARVLVINTREDLTIVREARRLLKGHESTISIGS